MLRSFVAVVALAVAPVAVRAADEENPYKNAKVGDYSTYTTTTEIGKFNVSGTVTQKVIKKDDKEATIEMLATLEFGGNKKDLPAQTQKIDLTKPFDPTKGTALPGGGEAKIEKGKEGKEKIKVGGKEYDCTWTNYKVKAKFMNQDIDADMKVWIAKEIPTGVAKMTLTTDLGGQKMQMTMELKETGNTTLPRHRRSRHNATEPGTRTRAKTRVRVPGSVPLSPGRPSALPASHIRQHRPAPTVTLRVGCCSHSLQGTAHASLPRSPGRRG